MLQAHMLRIKTCRVWCQAWTGVMCLDLAHSRATADATSAGVGAATCAEARHDSACEEGSEGEPEEGGAGLGLTAAGAGATGDDVVVEVGL